VTPLRARFASIEHPYTTDACTTCALSTSTATSSACPSAADTTTLGSTTYPTIDSGNESRSRESYDAELIQYVAEWFGSRCMLGMASFGEQVARSCAQTNNSNLENSFSRVPEFDAILSNASKQVFNVHDLPLGSLGMYLGAYLGEVRSNKRCYMVSIDVSSGL
jgi:hypothetical protein